MWQTCKKVRKGANTGKDKRTTEKIKEGGEKKRRRRRSEGGKTEPGREREPVWVCDKLSLRNKILLIPSGYHATSSTSACVYLCTCAGVCSRSRYSKQRFRIDLWRSRPYPSAPSAHSSRLTHIFSHSRWLTSIKSTKACTLRSAPAAIGLLTVPLKHV